MAYSNSSLVDCTVKSPNHSGTRTHAIDRITPHCVVGQLTAEAIGNCFVPTSRKASCNYGIGKDGRVCLCVDEQNRSWCSSSAENDQRAITIEVASDQTAPYAFTDAAYNKLVELCIDICKRNGITKLLWLGDKTTSLAYTPKSGEAILTCHRWFAAKECPGDWMYQREGDLASKVTAALGGSTTSSSTSSSSSSSSSSYQVKVTANTLNIRKGAGTNYAITGTIKDKGTYTIVETSGNWGKLKSGLGWICLDYTTKISGSSSSAASSTYQVKVTASALNIRKGAGTNYAITGTIRDKGTYTITETSGKWGKLKSGKGWICLDYTTKV